MRIHSQVSLDSVTWAPIAPAIDCDAFDIWNILSVTLKLRTNASDPTSEINVVSMQTYVVQSQKNAFLRKNAPVVYGQLASSSGNIVVISKS